MPRSKNPYVRCTLKGVEYRMGWCASESRPRYSASNRRGFFGAGRLPEPVRAYFQEVLAAYPSMADIPEDMTHLSIDGSVHTTERQRRKDSTSKRPHIRLRANTPPPAPVVQTVDRTAAKPTPAQNEIVREAAARVVERKSIAVPNTPAYRFLLFIMQNRLRAEDYNNIEVVCDGGWMRVTGDTLPVMSLITHLSCIEGISLNILNLTNDQLQLSIRVERNAV